MLFNKKRKSPLKHDFFKASYEKYLNLDSQNRFSINKEDFYPCLNDSTENTSFDTHYLYHPAWAARCLNEIKPVKHIDISSTVLFSSFLSAFIPTEFYDYRPAKIFNLSNLTCKSADLTNLHFESESVESLSCMHTIEHIGLGRYGDAINPNADKEAVLELIRILKKNGHLLFVVPIGKPRIEFNAHRIYSYDMIIELFPDFLIRNFSLIPDNAHDIGIIYNAKKEQTLNQKYACACFWLQKK